MIFTLYSKAYIFSISPLQLCGSIFFSRKLKEREDLEDDARRSKEDSHWRGSDAADADALNTLRSFHVKMGAKQIELSLTHYILEFHNDNKHG